VTFLLGAGYGRRALICVVVVGIVSTTMAGTSGAAPASPPRIADVAETTYGPAALRKKPPSPLALAKASLVAAHVRLTKRNYAKALLSLKALRDNLGQAHRAGMAQIGKPPSDPESDVPPGPAAVIAVLNLEHRIMMEVTFFNGLRTSPVIESLRYTLLTTHRLRIAMLSRVIALPVEGAGADYDDDMSDTLDGYTGEVALITRALGLYKLTPAARVGLAKALARARATQAKVNLRWGDGD
jgi:hypothetical protein